MRVTHRLASQSLSAIPAEAAWAEAMGYDALSKNETAHDSFIPLTLAATATTRAMLQTSVAIAFPRSPMITAYTARDLQDLGVVDQVIPEPRGGAHTDREAAVEAMGAAIRRHLRELAKLEPADLVESRRDTYYDIGAWEER